MTDATRTPWQPIDKQLAEIEEELKRTFGFFRTRQLKKVAAPLRKERDRLHGPVFTVTGVDKAGTSRSWEGRLASQVEHLGAELLQHGFTEVQVFDDQGTDFTFDFAFSQ